MAIIWGYISVVNIILRGNSLSTSCPRANYLGHKFRASNFQGAIILGGNCLGAIIQGTIVPGAIIQEAIIQEAIVQEAIVLFPIFFVRKGYW